MKLLTRGSRALTLTLALFTTACGGGEGGAADPIPTELAAVETAAETGFDAALKADQPQIAAAANVATSNWATYGKRATADGVPPAAFDAVSAAITTVNSLIASNAPAPAIARAFNQISAPMARIYAVYKPPVPATLLDLDYLGREVRADARAADIARATADLDTLTSQWAMFRTSLVAAGGAAQASQMDGTLAHARTAIAANDAAGLELAAVSEADAVDVIERFFALLDASD
jgi:hypothetical protein